MTIQHHPGETLLLDYATGTLGEAWSLAIATHLALCPACRHMVADMEALGGGMLCDSPVAQLPDAMFDRIMARASAAEPLPTVSPKPVRQDAVVPRLPEPLRSYVGGDVDDLHWSRLGVGAFQVQIPTRQSGATVRLLKIPAGKPVPMHSHGGLELTLVLCGAFADSSGSFGRGDLQEADETMVHKPVAAAGEDCICLAVTDAPLRFKGLAARLVQPFLKI